MEFQGTKGIWEINPRALRNVKCNELTIANCSAGQSGDKEEEEIANAKLIASAPDLLNNFISAIILLKQTTEFEVLESYKIKVLEFEKVLEKALT